MAKKCFAAYFIGEGDGCDNTYTIGCNSKLEILKAITLEDAKKEVGKKLEEFGADDEDTDQPIGKITIYEISDETLFDLEGWLDGKQVALDREEDELSEAEERAMLQKLKNKYETDDEFDDDSEESPKSNKSK